MFVRNSDLAYEKIRLMITMGKLKPGQVVVEAELIEQLGVGRTPIREALHRLSWEKFVRIIPRQCIMVNDLPLYELESIFQMRYTLSALEGELASHRCTEEQLLELRQTIDAIVVEKDPEKGVMLDRQFHRQVSRMSHNTFLIQQMDTTLDLCLRLLFLQKDQIESINTASTEEYETIYDCLARRDEHGLIKALQGHVLDFREIFFIAG